MNTEELRKKFHRPKPEGWGHEREPKSVFELWNSLKKEQKEMGVIEDDQAAFILDAHKWWDKPGVNRWGAARLALRNIVADRRQAVMERQKLDCIGNYKASEFIKELGL